MIVRIASVQVAPEQMQSLYTSRRRHSPLRTSPASLWRTYETLKVWSTPVLNQDGYRWAASMDHGNDVVLGSSLEYDLSARRHIDFLDDREIALSSDRDSDRSGSEIGGQRDEHPPKFDRPFLVSRGKGYHPGAKRRYMLHVSTSHLLPHILSTCAGSTPVAVGGRNLRALLNNSFQPRSNALLSSPALGEGVSSTPGTR